MNETPVAAAWVHRDGASPVPVTGNCSLGRAVANDIVLIDDRVSRRHATIHTQEAQELWLIDLGSRNGTYLNGRRVSQPTLLRDGDRIQIGPFQLDFHQVRMAGGGDQAAGLILADQTQVDLRSLACWLLVCDIEGSTVLAREHSPAELAILVGGWFARCKEVIEDNGGTINKYLGDGFLAYWPSRDAALPHVAQTLRDLRALQDPPKPPFRIVLHHGQVLLGGMPSSGEESLAGTEVHFVFRQEKLAGSLGLSRLVSAPAVALLGGLIAVTAAGEHTLPGFEGRHGFSTY